MDNRRWQNDEMKQQKRKELGQRGDSQGGRTFREDLII